MQTIKDRESLSRLLRELAWWSFEQRFAVPVYLPGVYGVFLEAIKTTERDAHDRMHVHTGRQYAEDELYLRNIGPCIREAQLLEAMQRPGACTAGLITWKVTDMATPFKVWFVHH